MAPDNHLVWSNLGDALYFEEGQGSVTSAFAKAEELVDQRLSVNPNAPSVLLGAAWIKTMLGKPSEANELIARAVGITPSDPYLYFMRALINLRQDRTSEALAKALVTLPWPSSKYKASPRFDQTR